MAVTPYAFTDQPDLDAPLNPEFPAPAVLLRPFGPTQLLSGQGRITASTYSGCTAVGSPGGKGIRIAGGASDGILHTSVALLNRTLYSCAVKFRLEQLGVNQYVAALNAFGGLGLRINTSDQLDLLADGVLVLDTSTFTFRLGTIYTLVLTVYAGSTFVYVNGQRIIAYAGVRDIDTTAQCYALGRRGSGLTTQVMTGTIIEAAFWDPNATLGTDGGSMWGGILTPVQAYNLSTNYNLLFSTYVPDYAKKASGTSVNAPGAGFTWSWAFSGGAASVTANPNAPAAAFTWSWEFAGGAASTGGTAANAPGADFTWTLALSAGAASVTANPSAPGAALGWNWAFSGGAASVPGTGTLPQVVLYVGDNLAIGTNGQPVVVLFV